jgi:hypothetical protein
LFAFVRFDAESKPKLVVFVPGSALKSSAKAWIEIRCQISELKSRSLHEDVCGPRKKRLIPSIWFNAEPCSPGLDVLGWYHEKHDEARNIGLGPEHDCPPMAPMPSA